ncbi:hypothetical protein DRO61_04675 [Candidatus Bathyarchaeota archaeon]|jgi:Fe-S oxidoreductase|nr:MAG: hypothetical protein DRO61_04675 [Candidatus Bathyarchaeota archaeon]
MFSLPRRPEKKEGIRIKQERIVSRAFDKSFLEEIARDPDCKEIYNCIQCGVCTGACPLSAYVRKLSPRKIIALTREGNKEALTEALETLEKCLLCGQCQTFCPAGIKIKEILLKLRELGFKLGKVPEGLMAVNEITCDVFNAYMEPHANRKNWIKSSSLEKFASKNKAKIGYFAGCTASYKGPEICQADAKILTELNEDWTLLDEEWCCGAPFFYIGNTEKAREFANHNVEEIEKKGVDVVIAHCPTCWYILKFKYPKLLHTDLRFKVMHITEYIIDQLNNGKIEISEKLSGRVTYHDPCDLARYSDLGMTDLPREIIARITENFVEIPLHGKDSQCCGAGGSFDSVDTKLRQQHSTRRLKQAEDTEAEILITTCAGCKFFLSGEAKKEKSKLVFKDLTELVYSSMHGNDVNV